MKSIYQFHNRKTGGTSLNFVMLDHASLNDSDAYKKLLDSNGKGYNFPKGKVVGWDRNTLMKGQYFYGFSHIPMHQIKLDLPNFYTISIFRDPVDRVISHYKMLEERKKNNPSHSLLSKEGNFIEEGFSGFIERLPNEHLLNQLYMFSVNFNIAEAVANIRSLDCIFQTENFSIGIDSLNRDLGLNLKSYHKRKTSKIMLDSNLIKKLKEKLRPEYEMLEEIGFDYK